MAAILLIDDNSEVRWMLRAALEGAGHSVAEAHNGLLGLELYTARDIDLVVTDIYMPDYNGIEFLQALAHLGRGTPILAMSAGQPTGETVGLEAARELGAAAVMAKPFEMTDFLATVERLLTAAA